MRLDRLDLTRYGRFTEISLAFAPPAPKGPDLHVVYGPNEAGKSTLFAAWLDLLFGIPLRSRYDFLHPGPTMQIGARLSHAGGELELKRLKRKDASLIDIHDAPVPEAVLHPVLGGLSRDGYSAMFSLDDDTLEKGGDSILASRGDLGEMLFSASAGLSGLAPGLEAIRTDLDGFHRSGRRSGWLHDARKQLAELDRQRRAIEVSASALQKLGREAAAAEQGWREARAREERLKAELDRLQDLAGTLPLLARLDRVQERLSPLQDLPDAGDLAQEQLARIERDRLTLATRIGDRALRLKALEDQLAMLAPDPEALARSAAIEAAEALRPGHDTAISDLPRRHQEADEIAARIRRLLSDLGHPDRSAQDLVLPGPRIARLRGLLSARSGLVTAVAAAQAETRKAADLLARERERLGEPGPVEDEGALAALVARLRARDPAEARSRALRDRDLAQLGLAHAIGALAPWAGDAERLAALAVPPGGQIADWEAALESARQTEVDARREANDLHADLQRLGSEGAGRARAQSATGVTLADAAAARTRREALWSAHLSDLTPASAVAFEQALREDDRVTALLAEAMAEARRDALDEAARDALSARLEGARTRAEAAQAAQAGLLAGIDRACEALGLSGTATAGTATAGTALAELRRWLDLRLAALEARAALHEAESALLRAEEALEAATGSLQAALGPDRPEAADFEVLLARAIGRLEAADRRSETRRRLTGLEADLRDRERVETGATGALTLWQQDWAAASRDTVLAGRPHDDPGLGTALDLLDRLAEEERTLAGLTDRIAKMDANRDQFRAAKQAILHALALEEATPWADVLARLRRAQDSARDDDALRRQIAEETRQDVQDRREQAARDDEAAVLGAQLGWSAAQGTSLADHVARCREAAALRHEIATLRDELRDRPAPTEAEDADTVRHGIERLKTEQQLLRDETEARHAAHIEAKRRIEAVGGDDALARIAAERENLLLEIRERAQAHLAARFGLLAVEAGLRRYRDHHRSAMLARASDAFNRLSRGAYAGLAAQPDGAQEVLVALPAQGGAKFAADLSKGTRFQLYLALRIAGYHELARSRPTVPFIADDIMETFDDDRSAAAFALLAEMSRTGQVIYLTHHRHLCDIALAVCPEANVVDLRSA